jgi:putative ABC transport system ATP-binding protein
MDFCNMYTFGEREKRAMELLEQVEMGQHAHKLPSALSGGEQQRVAIARALANDPPILVADEPTGNLDSRTAEAVLELFEGLVAQGKTIVMVTHDRDLSKRASRIITIADGEIVAETMGASVRPALASQAEFGADPSTSPTSSDGEEVEADLAKIDEAEREDRHA